MVSQAISMPKYVKWHGGNIREMGRGVSWSCGGLQPYIK